MRLREFRHCLCWVFGPVYLTVYAGEMVSPALVPAFLGDGVQKTSSGMVCRCWFPHVREVLLGSSCRQGFLGQTRGRAKAHGGALARTRRSGPHRHGRECSERGADVGFSSNYATEAGASTPCAHLVACLDAGISPQGRGCGHPDARATCWSRTSEHSWDTGSVGYSVALLLRLRCRTPRPL